MIQLAEMAAEFENDQMAKQVRLQIGVRVFQRIPHAGLRREMHDLRHLRMPPGQRLHPGAVGDVQMVAIREHRFPFLPKVGNWNRFSRNTGGTLVEKCCHFFDLMNLITGRLPVQLFASGGQNVNHLDEFYEGERSDILDNAFVIVDYDDGVRAMLDLCMFAEVTLDQEELVVVGDRGKLDARLPSSVLHIGRRGRQDIADHQIGQVETTHVENSEILHEGLHHGSSYLEHVGFADAIRNGTPAEVTLTDGLWSVAVGEAAHRSIAERRPVAMAELIPER